MVTTPDKRTFLIVMKDQAKRDYYYEMIGKHISQAVIFTAPDALTGSVKLLNAPPNVLVIEHLNTTKKGYTFLDEVLDDKSLKNLAIIVGEQLPEKEKYLDELVSGQVQFLGAEKNEAEFTHCLFKALNFITHRKESEFYLRFLAEGDTLMKEGAKADFVFIVKKGRLRAYRQVGEKKVVLGHIEVGEFVGEMAYVNGEPRSANVEAVEDCELIEIPVGTLERVLYKRPGWSRKLLSTLSRRLKQANAAIVRDNS